MWYVVFVIFDESKDEFDFHKTNKYGARILRQVVYV